MTNQFIVQDTSRKINIFKHYCHSPNDRESRKTSERCRFESFGPSVRSDRLIKPQDFLLIRMFVRSMKVIVFNVKIYS